ncbi:COQ5 [Auxenochlorella protothecoides x Auxenochlorella symbiontica]
MESASILARLSSCAHAGSRPMDPAMPCLRARSARINSFKRHLVQPQRDSVAHVDASERQELFDSISPMYDRLNDVLSLGLHRVWKRMAVKWSGARPGDRVLDLCCGSGDLTFLLGEAVGPRGQVVGLDFSGAMLASAAQRELDRPRFDRLVPPLQWVQGDALDLPFPDASFQAATMGYGLRNVTDIPRALQELYRVLAPGGAAAILDFNNAVEDSPVADGVQSFLLGTVVVPAARALGVAEQYEYLRPSIQRFPTGRKQEALALQAGFAQATHYTLGFGMMGVLVVEKR